ncbi:Pyridine nucleotide-disulfide oxidoreductase, FAD/NAD(P)-binding domain protein [Kalmanozyma brasiliensis GHG001]|uniref:Uncharacterized protein n=1 Tax=Kalmanozyma brasiliensis (strain GHG001) TaxID=1365824 RepID=V5EV41_KALBG|nr:Pyridine nucleotide-disulfide oxidoreductase, FAD/NAD(P)-binding domain protein [Kalmanozyma brasiliensis GHG001]EST06024.1 Pyridine nucleotide-disulfide oxidoreductase, FAD/NAD(P)-binding domain protein [Kalmanozyma brasiliensis GHG001]
MALTRSSASPLLWTLKARPAFTPSIASTSIIIPKRAYATETTTPPRKKRLVVLGTGWGGYAFLKNLSWSTIRQFDVKVVSPTTAFSFTPLLAQASCATLDFRSAIEPIHSNRAIEHHHAWCDAVDFKAQKIELTSAFRPQFKLSDPLLPPSSTGQTEAVGERATYSLSYDHLVICVGAYNATFGTKGVKENALFLKDVADARAIRWRIMGLFEAANTKQHQYAEGGELSAEQEGELRKLLSFVIVGGGPTGSEFAAELHDLIKEDLSRLYPNLRPYPSIHLLDAGSTILSSFDKSLSDYAVKKFSRDGIEMRLNARISRVERDAVVLEGEERVGAGMVVWSTGVTTSPLIDALRGVGKEERSGKVLTNDTLNVLVNASSPAIGGSVLHPDKYPSSEDVGELVPLPNVFALGDCASQQSHPLPATAQVANQKGTYLAHLFNTSNTSKPFEFANKGSMASLGSRTALIDSPQGKNSGALAWVLWRSAYTIMSMSWRNRFLVPANWASNLLFGRDVGRF